MKSDLLQIRFQLNVLIDGHAIDDLCPFLTAVCVAAAFIADEKGAAGLQHTPNLAEALRQVRPEIDRFKSRNSVEPITREDHIRHAALQDRTASLRDGGLIELFCSFHADR